MLTLLLERCSLVLISTAFVDERQHQPKAVDFPVARVHVCLYVWVRVCELADCWTYSATSTDCTSLHILVAQGFVRSPLFGKVQNLICLLFQFLGTPHNKEMVKVWRHKSVNLYRHEIFYNGDNKSIYLVINYECFTPCNVSKSANLNILILLIIYFCD